MAVLSRNFRWVFLGEKIRKFLGSPSVSASAPSPPQPEVRNMSVLSGLASEPRTPLSSKARMKRLPKKNQNEKYRLKYLRLRRAAKATVFVSLGLAAPTLGTVYPTSTLSEKEC